MDTIKDQKRADIKEFFDDSEKFSSDEADKWLNSLGFNENQIDDFTNKVFATNKVYTSSTLFIKDLEGMIKANINNLDINKEDKQTLLNGIGDNILSIDELNYLFTLFSQNDDISNVKSARSVKNGSSLESSDSITSSGGADYKNKQDYITDVSEPNEYSQTGGDVEIVGVETSEIGSDRVKHPQGLQAGDQEVLTISYSTDHAEIDIQQLQDDGWSINFNAGAANGKSEFNGNDGDLMTLIATRNIDDDDKISGTYKVPTKDGKNDVSAQLTGIRGGTIDLSSMTSVINDESKDRNSGAERNVTNFADNNADAPFFLNIASADDPFGYEKSKPDDVLYYGGTHHGDDAGATFVTDVAFNGSLNANYEGRGGRNDHSISIAIKAW